jgi:hypothetical protein
MKMTGMFKIRYKKCCIYLIICNVILARGQE